MCISVFQREIFESSSPQVMVKVFSAGLAPSNELAAVVVVVVALVAAVAGFAAPNEIPVDFGTVTADVAGVEDFAPSVKDGAVVVAAFGVANESEGVGKADAAVDVPEIGRAHV